MTQQGQFLYEVVFQEHKDIMQKKMFQSKIMYLKRFWINWIISKTHHSISKILFVLGADDYLERLEGKIRKCLFFYVKIF